MNNNILKSLAVVGLAAAVLVACDDQAVNKNDAAGSASSVQVSGALGLPVSGTLPGTDVFGNSIDAQGNVCVAQNLTIDGTTTLHNFVHVLPGFTITFAPGVTVRGVKQSATSANVKPGTLIIERGAQINAAGTASSPITFTSDLATPAPGDWGGIVVLGRADANILGTRGTTPSGVNGVGIIEGLGTTVPATLCSGFTTAGRYGNGDLPAGSYNTESSGTIQYVRIAYAGFALSAGNELNSLTLGGVGSGTTLDHVQVHKGFDDGFEFFGGTVNGTYLVSSGSADDDFDTDQGYSGKLQFGFVARAVNNSYLADAPLNGGESNGDNDDDVNANTLTSAQFSNFTIVGPYQNTAITALDQDYRAGTYYRDLSKQDLFNSVILGFPYGIEVSSESGFTLANLFNYTNPTALDATKTDIRNTTIVVPAQSLITGVTTAATFNDATGASFNTEFLTSGLNNAIFTATSTTVGNTGSQAGTSNARISTGTWNFVTSGTLPTPLPTATSSLLNSADFSLLSGFTVVTYRGAFNNTTNWLSGWTIWN